MINVSFNLFLAKINMLKDWEEMVNKKYEQYEPAGNFCQGMKPNVNSRNEIYALETKNST